jgi:hypothetical protein
VNRFATDSRSRKFVMFYIVLLSIYQYLFPPNSSTDLAILFRNTVFAGLAILAIDALIRRGRSVLFDKLWTFRFFIREKRWDRKIRKKEEELRWRKSFEVVKPIKPLSEYERFDDGQLMWAWVKYYLPIQTGVYDRANDCIAYYYDRAIIASFQHFIEYGKIRIAENEGSRDGPTLNGPYYDIFMEERRKENLMRVILDNAKSFHSYKADMDAQLVPASEARKIVLCKQFLDSVYNLLWSRIYGPLHGAGFSCRFFLVGGKFGLATAAEELFVFMAHLFYEAGGEDSGRERKDADSEYADDRGEYLANRSDRM